MRRIIAALMDFCVTYLLGTILFFVVISICGQIKNYIGRNVGKYMGIGLVLTYLIIYLLTAFIFSFVSDMRMKGITLGKYITGYRIMVKESIDYKYKRWAVYHGLLKSISTLLYPLTLLYYIFMLQMPYDKILGIYDSAKESDLISIEIKYRNEINKTSDRKVLPHVPCNGQANIEKRNNKRILELIIDIIVSIIIYTILLFLIGFFMRFGTDYIVVLFFATSHIGTYIWLNFFLLDYFGKGSSLGKKIAGIRLQSGGERISLLMCVGHSFIKTISCIIYPISILYFLLKKEIFYDKWFGLDIVEEDRRCNHV